MAQRLKAIPTTYHGIEFRSKLEAKYAQAFDRLGIVWEYEGHGFRFDDGTCYCPDFYMPEIDTYFEVKGVLDDESKRKIELLSNEGKRVVVGMPNGTLKYYGVLWPSSEDYKDTPSTDEGIVSGCAECGKTFILPCSGEFTCACCGAYDGDHHLTSWDDNLFMAAGWESGF